VQQVIAATAATIRNTPRPVIEECFAVETELNFSGEKE
jgi:hypothetical protein